MNVKHSLSLFVNNINLSFKALLYNLIVLVAFTALIVLVVRYNLSVITSSAQAADLVSSITNSFAKFAAGDMTFIAEITERFTAFFSFVLENLSSVIWAIVLGSLIFYVENVVLGVCNYTLTKVVDAHMATISKLGFIEALISSLKSSLPFEAIFTLVKAVVFVLIGGLSFLFVWLTIPYLTVFSLIIAIWLSIFLIALFFTVTALFRPSVINGSGIKAAFKARVEGKQFWLNLASYVLSITVAIVINVTFFFTTFGAGVIISFSLTGLYFACLKLVIYYNINNRKYFIDYDNIVTPKGLREDKELLEKVDVE